MDEAKGRDRPSTGDAALRVPCPDGGSARRRLAGAESPRRGGAESLDRSRLDAIRALDQPESPDVFSEIVALYLETAAELIGALAAAGARQDAQALSAAAHTLKASSAGVGAATLSALCRDLELTADRGESSGAAAQLAAIDAEFAEVRRLLKAELEKP